MASETVTVYDKDGNQARVGREWLERWPDDFTKEPPSKKTGGSTKKEAHSGS
jgi:hypothetical protein